MISFKDFINETEAIPEMPPGARADLWNNPSYRKFFNVDKAPNLSAVTPSLEQQPQQRAALQGYQDLSSIEAGVRSAVGRITGMPRTGTIDMIKPVDMSLALAIEKAVQIGRGMRRPQLGENLPKIQPQPSEISAMEAGRGVHFYINKNGKTAFVIN
jgi:hypothetical protein